MLRHVFDHPPPHPHPPTHPPDTGGDTEIHLMDGSFSFNNTEASQKITQAAALIHFAPSVLKKKIKEM